MKHSQMRSLLIIGGCLDKKEVGCLSSFEQINIFLEADGPRFEIGKVGDLLEQRRSPSVLNCVTGLTILGGCERENNHLNSIEILTKVNNIWCSSLLPNTITNHSCAAYLNVDKKLGVIFGGYDGIDCLNEYQVVDLETISVRNVGKLPCRLKNSFAIKTNGKIFLLGGWDEQRTMRTVYSVDYEKLTEFKFSMVGLLPYPVEGHAAITHKDAIYIIGGYDGFSVVKTIIRYDTSNNRAEILPIMLKTARENHVAACVFDEYLLVIAGWSGRESLSSIEVFKMLDNHPFLRHVECNETLDVTRNRPALISL